MAFTNVIRRVTPATIRATQNLFRNSFSTAPQQDSPATRRQCKRILVKVIDSEIDEVENVPESFPFKIEDTVGAKKLRLTRDDHGECITVEVDMPAILSLGDQISKSPIRMNVKVSKQLYYYAIFGWVGPCMEFGVSAYNDRVKIRSLLIEGGEDKIADRSFGELDKDLQTALHKYLEVRGINPSLTNFLHQYVMKKDKKDYVQWLKKVKKCVGA